MSERTETAILAGGCFWVLQELLRDREGVISTRAGWIGGRNDHPTEENNVGHAEAVEVVFDPDRTSFRSLLEYYFHVHRPDLGEAIVGSCYRPAIFYTSEEQQRVAEATIRDVDASGHWPGEVVTELREADRFWAAEAADQEYLRRSPGGFPAAFPPTGAGREQPEPTAALG
jgi:peptide-methionine (S)-S-oxide reductase